jgi:hypothetical protein
MEVLNVTGVRVGCTAAIGVVLGIVGGWTEVNNGVPAGAFLVI